MKENRIEDRINKAYCFLNSMHSDFRTGLYYKEDLENLEHILSDYKKLQEEFKQVDYECERLEEKEVRLIKENEELKSENRRLKVIRYSREYGTENIHLITKSDLVEINTNKYFIEIQDGKFVDLKQVYQENEELKEIYRSEKKMKNEYIKLYQDLLLKENIIPIQKVKDKIEDKIAEIEADKLNYGEYNWYLESELKGYAIYKLKELLESEDSKDGEN